MPEDEKAWRELRFKMSMREDLKEFKATHLLIANEILKPMIDILEEDMDVWRVHRLWDTKKGVHRFMFKFYGPLGLCSRFLDQTSSYEHFDRLKDIESLELEGFVTKGANIEDDHDNWSYEMKAVWPHFICGVSKAWLKMIEVLTTKEGEQTQGRTYEEVLAIYARINKKLEDNWATHGGHAMLHHLYAVFGYTPVVITRPGNPIRDLQPVIIGIEGIPDPMPGLRIEMDF